ncbi:MAG: hypothetical protein V1685_03910 [Parcubacteria group bacterium]
MNTQAKWYVELVSKVRELCEEIGLDDAAESKVRELMIEKAKDQYMAGNRSGIRWARQQASGKAVA